MRPPAFTATLDRAPVEGFPTSNWSPSYFSRGDGTYHYTAEGAALWAEDVEKFPPDALAIIDVESPAKALGVAGPLHMLNSPQRDARQLECVRLCREALGPSVRPIVVTGVEWIPYWVSVNSEDLVDVRDEWFAAELADRFRALKPLCELAESICFGAYIGRAVGDPDFPNGTMERDLRVLTNQVRLARLLISDTLPVYVFVRGQAHGERPLSRAECDVIARAMRQLNVIPVVWGDAGGNATLLEAIRWEDRFRTQFYFPGGN